MCKVCLGIVLQHCRLDVRKIGWDHANVSIPASKPGNDSMCTTASGDNFFDVCVSVVAVECEWDFQATCSQKRLLQEIQSLH
ncbi:hypothetical protein EMCRGX_G002083 [Ephydatia muelleri]